MDQSRFDRLSKALAAGTARRSLVQAAAALAIAAVPALPGDASAAHRGKRPGIGAEHFRHKKKNYCLDGKTIRRYRRKQEQLLTMGATLGKCGDTPCIPATCEALGSICGPAADGCGGTLQCGDCDLDLDCCSGQCVNLESDDNNCGECGIVCDIADFFECSVGLCQTG